METVVHIDEQKNIAYLKIIGAATSDGILQILDQAVSSEKYCKGMGRLWDFTEVDLSTFDAQTISKMARYSKKFSPGICDVKVAFVVTKTMEYGLTRMFQTYSEMYASTRVMIFTTLEAAEKWIMD